jgi:hypothetical protein
MLLLLRREVFTSGAAVVDAKDEKYEEENASGYGRIILSD